MPATEFTCSVEMDLRRGTRLVFHSGFDWGTYMNVVFVFGVFSLGKEGGKKKGEGVSEATDEVVPGYMERACRPG